MDINVPPKLAERALNVYAKKTGNQMRALKNLLNSFMSKNNAHM